MKARAAWVLVVGSICGCGSQGDFDDTGTVLDTCTGESIGHVAEDGSLVFDSGLVISPSDLDAAVELDEPPSACTASPPAGPPGASPQATGYGTVLSLEYSWCVAYRGCCQAVYTEWCWNGSCSHEAGVYCE